MTITLQAVNELIQSLESAGELSIKERKYLELAKAYQQLAAENVELKAGVTYFAYSPEYGFDYFKDKQSAIDTAQAEIDAYREDADDGWSEDVQRVSWGVVIQQAQGFDAQGLHTSDSQHTYQTCNYRLVDSVETPATDAYLAGVKADGRVEGAHFVANRMLAAWDAGFIEDTAKNAADIARMILTSTEFMADAPEGDFDRSFADGILEDIAQQLREGAE
ncbi:hypothetical protein FMK94_04800 [Klebsiella grimontii]|nr:hypothetical protein [Klebsiella grimontii]MBZ7513592.1 hypothetical protein [Klebsiella grimontii]